jgi:hypothetical protein
MGTVSKALQRRHVQPPVAPPLPPADRLAALSLVVTRCRLSSLVVTICTSMAENHDHVMKCVFFGLDYQFTGLSRKNTFILYY